MFCLRLLLLAGPVFWGLPAAPARAQFLMPRSFLGGVGPLDAAQAKLSAGLNPLSLFNAPGKTGLGLTSRTANYFFVGASAGETVRIVKGGVVTTNLGGSGQTLYADVSRNTLRGEFFYQMGRQNGLSRKLAKNRRTDAHGTTSEAAFRVTTRLFGSPSWNGFAGISTARADINVGSTALLHLLPVFGDATPSAQVETGSQESVAGLCWNGPRSFVFGAAGRFDAPGSGRLFADSETQVTLPLNARGSLWSVGGQVAFGGGQRGQAAAFLSNRSARGTGSVTQAGGGGETTLGEGHTFQNERVGSLAVSWQIEPENRFSLTYSRSSGQFDTFGGGLLAQPLGFSPDLVNRVGYYARARVIREETGVGWEKGVGRGQNIAVSGRYVRFPVSASYGYSGRLFLLSYGEGETFSEPSARGFALRGRYEIPLSVGKTEKTNRPRLVLGIEQIIPLPLARRKESIGSTPSTPATTTENGRTRTRGGWSVSAGVAYPF